MKGITLITPRGLTYEEAAPIIKNEFRDLGSRYEEAPGTESNGYLYLGETPHSLAVYFSPTDRLNDANDFEPYEMEKIPYEPFATDVNFRLYSVVCRLVKALLVAFPDLYICDDQLGFIGPAAEFVAKYSSSDFTLNRKPKPKPQKP